MRAICWILALLAVAGLLTAFPISAQPPVSADAESAAESSSRDDQAEYYKLFTMLADAIAQVEENYVKPIDRKEIFAAAVRGIMRDLDPHSSYIDPEEFDQFRQEVESEFGGLGIQIGMENGLPVIISPLVGTPAYEAGVQAGDRILEIDGQSTDGLTLSDVVARLKGKSGSSVNVTLARSGQSEPLEVNITRRRIRVHTVLGYRHGADDKWDYVLEQSPKIGYVRISAFSRETASELRRVLEQLQAQGVKGLVVDLRFNPGGLLVSAIEVSDLFIPEGLIVATDGRNTERKEWRATRTGTFEDFAVAVLVNRFSASASEVVSACLQDHGRAIVVGERTWGKGSVQNVVELENGQGALRLTTASYHRPSGKNINRFADAGDEDEWGVTPDEGYRVRLSGSQLRRLIEDERQRDIIRPPSSRDPSVEGSFEDPQLQKALEYLREEVSRRANSSRAAG